jgi:hypothetical protein
VTTPPPPQGTVGYGASKPQKKRRRSISTCCYLLMLIMSLAGIAVVGWPYLADHHRVRVKDHFSKYQAKYEQGLETVTDLSEKAKALLGNTQEYSNKVGVEQFFEKKPMAVNDNYVVFISVSDGSQTFIQMGMSPTSPQLALKAAQAKLPRKTNKFPYVKLDIVTGVKRYEDFNYYEPLSDTPSVFYGIALDWTKDWVFLGEEVAAAGMVDANSFVRLERIAHYATQMRKIRTWALPEYSDDTTTVDVFDVFHSESIFLQLEGQKAFAISLYHGHRLFPRITPEIVNEAAEMAGSYLESSVKDTGRFVYHYNPRSDYEPFGYSLPRHAGALYAMATLYATAPTEILLDSMKLGMGYLKEQIKDCPIPYSPQVNAKCVVDYEPDNHSISQLEANAMTVLAMAQYLHATGVKDADLIEVGKDIALFMIGSQREDGSFCQKVRLNAANGSLELVETEFASHVGGAVTFALARLHTVFKDMGPLYVKNEYVIAANKAATYIVTQAAPTKDEEFTVDHWLLHAIAELPTADDTLVDHAMRTARVARHYQNGEMEAEDDLDLVGIYYNDMSATASATKVEGLCAMYELAVAKGKKEDAAMILDSTTLSLRYQLQTQYRPEQAMYMRDPNRIMGGFHDSISESQMRSDYTQHNLSSLLCMKRMLGRILESGAK